MKHWCTPFSVLLALGSVLCILLLTISSCQAQNYIVNGSFEQVPFIPDGLCQFYLVNGWNNPAGEGILPAPNPDYYHRSGTGKGKAPQTYYGNIKPLDGAAMAGIICYASWHPNMREYLTTQLRMPLTPKTKYRLTFHLSNGHPERVCNSSVANVGVGFSTAPFVQRESHLFAYESKGATTPLTFSENWYSVTIDFEADTSYEYMVLGNFYDDAHSGVRHEYPGIDSCAYYFVDEVSLVELHPEDAGTEEAVQLKPLPMVISTSLDKLMQFFQDRPRGKTQNSTHPPRPSTPEDSRPIRGEKRIAVAADTIVVSILDMGSADGDTVSVQYNGEWLLEYHGLSKEPVTLRLPVEDEKPNTLIFFAHNEGSVPPNTAVLRYRDGSNPIKAETIHATHEYCGAVTFYHKRKKK